VGNFSFPLWAISFWFRHWKKILKSTNICQSYSKNKSGTVFLTHSVLLRLIGRPWKTPIWWKNLLDISYTSWLIADFLLKFANFCCACNEVVFNKNCDDSVWLDSPKTPRSVQKSGTYLKCKLSCGEFCVKIWNFSFHGNRGWSDTNFVYTVNSADPDNPLFGAIILVISLAQAE